MDINYIFLQIYAILKRILNLCTHIIFTSFGIRLLNRVFTPVFLQANLLAYTCKYLKSNKLCCYFDSCLRRVNKWEFLWNYVDILLVYKGMLLFECLGCENTCGYIYEYVFDSESLKLFFCSS